MTKHYRKRFGGGRGSGPRSPGDRGKAIALFVSLGLLVCALPAWSAEVVEVRVGKHPTFTRVVFELDRAAGYRIERSDPSADVTELVVSLEASSSTQAVKSHKSLIKMVEIESMGSRSLAKIRLAEDGLRLKEMILANPPRIVLDLMNDSVAANVVAAKPAKAKAKAKTTAPSPSDAEIFEEIVSKIDEPEPQVVKAMPEPVQEIAEPEPAPQVEEEPAAEPVVAAAVEAIEEVVDDASADVADASDAAEAMFDEDPQLAEGSEPSTSIPMDEPETEAYVAEATAPPTPAAAPDVPRTPRPMVAKKTDDEGGSWMTWAIAGVGAFVLLLGGVFIARRRSASSSDDEWDDDDASDSAGSGFALGNDEETVVDDNPFAASGQTVLGGPDDVTANPMGMNDGDDTVVSLPDEEKESESVVFDAGENVMDDMEVISRDQVNESLGGSAMPPAMGAAVPEDMAQMFAEMTRRMEALESRCDELVDARDRLERQVAAQTEELRVQRAAIARTQRAVRNLGRGEEGEEQEATEPALRDPNQPSSE